MHVCREEQPWRKWPRLRKELNNSKGQWAKAAPGRGLLMLYPGSSLGLGTWIAPTRSTQHFHHWTMERFCPASRFKNLTTCLLIAAVSWTRTKCSRYQAFPLPGVVDVHRSRSSTRGETGWQGSESRLQSKNTITEGMRRAYSCWCIYFSLSGREHFLLTASSWSYACSYITYALFIVIHSMMCQPVRGPN